MAHKVAKDFTTRQHRFKAGDPIAATDMDSPPVARDAAWPTAEQQKAFDELVLAGLIVVEDPAS